jgi:hypothetical protein
VLGQNSAINGIVVRRNRKRRSGCQRLGAAAGSRRAVTGSNSLPPSVDERRSSIEGFVIGITPNANDHILRAVDRPTSNGTSHRQGSGMADRWAGMEDFDDRRLPNGSGETATDGGIHREWGRPRSKASQRQQWRQRWWRAIVDDGHHPGENVQERDRREEPDRREKGPHAGPHAERHREDRWESMAGRTRPSGGRRGADARHRKRERAAVRGEDEECRQRAAKGDSNGGSPTESLDARE